MTNTNVDTILLELRRGVLILAVLSQLEHEEYGYSLLTRLAEGGLEIDQGTLYPLMRRLESQGLLESSWRIEEARPRRYYMLSAQGRQAVDQLTEEWRRLGKVMDGLLGGISD
jgi:DNA-binding PadR family transcriptional regulator